MRDEPPPPPLAKAVSVPPTKPLRQPRGRIANLSERLGIRLWNSAFALLTCTALFWAGNSIVGRAARDLVPPVALSFWRWAIALALLMVVATPYVRRDWPVLRARWKIVSLLAILGVAAFNTLLYSGLQHTTALNGMLLQAAQPAIILLIGFAMFRDHAGARQITGIAISLAGVLMILARADIGTLLRLRLNAGDALIAIAVLLWSGYTVLLRRRPAVHPLSFLAATLAIGVLAILPFYVAEVASGRFIQLDLRSALAIGYVSVFPSLLAYACFNRGVELIGSAATGQYLNIMPAFGALMAVGLLGESLELFHLIGVVLIGAGIIIARPFGTAIASG